MADLLDLLGSQVSESMIGALAGQIGGKATNAQTSNAVNDAMSVLMSALAKNATNDKGASDLSAALDRDHDGSILDDVAGFINGSSSFGNQRAANGGGILGHILGNKQDTAIDALSKSSGLSKGQVLNMLIKLAPIVLGMLGKQKREQGINPGDLAGMLAGAAGASNKRSGNAGLLTSFLDQDGDGDIKDDAARIGFNFLKNILFKRKR